MKAKNLFFGALACLAFAACSNDDEPVVNPGGDSNEQFVVVNIATPSITRAAGDKYGPIYGVDPDGEGPETAPILGYTYEDGVEKENEVKNALFVFFDAGNKVVASTKVTTFTTTRPGNNSSGVYTEAITSAVVALNEPTSTPKSVIAIVNTDMTDATFSNGTTMANVTAKIADYSKYTESSTDYFVMSNSVWQDNCATAILPEHLANKSNPTPDGDETTEVKPEDLAKATPVNIYVERVLARVDVKKANTLTTGLLGDQLGKIDPATNTVKFNQWDGEKMVEKEMVIATEFTDVHLSYTAPVSYIVKQLPATVSDAEWNTTTYGQWNDAVNKRSYWAQSVAPGADNKWGTTSVKSWGFVKYGQGSEWLADWSGDKEIQMYCQENTTTTHAPGQGAATKLVITARHSATVEGSPIQDFDLIKYKGQYWLEEDFIKQAQTDAGLQNYYYVTGSPSITENVDGTSTIESDITNDWTSKFKLTRRTDKSTKQYVAVPTIIDVPTTIYTKVGEDTYKEATVTIADEVAKLSEAWCWQDGEAYYYVDINHLNNTSSVVRNHIYDLTINSIKGLGTPVFNPETDRLISNTPGEEPDPENPIIPEKPEDQAFFISAQLNILKWRIVRQGVNIGW